MSDEMVGTVKLGTDGWPIKYCKDRHGNFGWVGMILPPWDRNGTYDFVSDDNRATIYPAAAQLVYLALDGALPQNVEGTMRGAWPQVDGVVFIEGEVDLKRTAAQLATKLAPRRIEKQDELDALPETVVIMDDNGAVARKYGGEWRWVGMEVSFPPSLPVTVLWSPEAAS